MISNFVEYYILMSKDISFHFDCQICSVWWRKFCWNRVAYRN